MRPSAKGQLVLHVNTFTKKESYAYMLERYGPDTCKWPYIPEAGPQPSPAILRPARNLPPGRYPQRARTAVGAGVCLPAGSSSPALPATERSSAARRQSPRTSPIPHATPVPHENLR